ncbi:hypothetical protein BKA56DRAFT_711815 [Ilyonectria sp. MPI-CAGE-AT-0026]|nr:hypothetical protein BKA56DRAFT_711815 [Ilyonectria sp. MPI-CAGE-AT-0026]
MAAVFVHSAEDSLECRRNHPRRNRNGATVDVNTFVEAMFLASSGKILVTENVTPNRGPMVLYPDPGVALRCVAQVRWTSSLTPNRHFRGSDRRHSQAHARCSGWDDVHRRSDGHDTIPDEEALYEGSTGEQRLFDINLNIKRELTELLNCENVRSDTAFRMWVQTRLMETEKELRSGRRRQSSASLH